MPEPAKQRGKQTARQPARQRIVVATGNPGKIREIAAILAQANLDLVPQSQWQLREVEETGATFVENALLKARNATGATGLPAIADDSGIEVDALNGAPGIYSARYAGVGASDQANLDKLIADVAQVPDADRTARFHCVMVYLRHRADAVPIICHGVWEGRLLHEPKGTNGFGYDPLFYVPEYDCSSAELEPHVKNAISHRGQALQELARRLR